MGVQQNANIVDVSEGHWNTLTWTVLNLVKIDDFD